LLKGKVKGTSFERLLAEILNNNLKGGKFKRIPLSGAIGTALNEPDLQGDVVGEVPSFERKFRIEAKVGYGGATQLTLKKEWLDKIIEDSRGTNSIPLMMGKFSGAREGIKVFVAMDLDTFCDLINKVTDLHNEVLDNERREMEHR
jgi:Holliday junction resolvase